MPGAPDGSFRRNAPAGLIVPPTEALGLIAVPISTPPPLPLAVGKGPRESTAVDSDSSPSASDASRPRSAFSQGSSEQSSTGNTCHVAEGDLHCCLEEVLAIAAAEELSGSGAAARLTELVAEIRRDANDMREDRVTAEWLLATQEAARSARGDGRAEPFGEEDDLAAAGARPSSGAHRQSAILLCAGLAVAVAGGAAVKSGNRANALAKELRESTAECARLRTQLDTLRRPLVGRRPRPPLHEPADEGEADADPPLAQAEVPAFDPRRAYVPGAVPVEIPQWIAGQGLRGGGMRRGALAGGQARPPDRGPGPGPVLPWAAADNLRATPCPTPGPAAVPSAHGTCPRPGGPCTAATMPCGFLATHTPLADSRAPKCALSAAAMRSSFQLPLCGV
eukprot:CAMPEP_0206019392 /NCGR_PEP_ID=MMETSP1464-20131121/28977_1 /ASSEMBLY_ACC=CAM_ASM_001124 /TAXON_ID=119497 /ORGANISM="Exanthemachrysis gayraliae, Strain RCC1523" /LENGTH=393 /DNA_ID=CAMNT_0053393291 /DNA_START=14 /DNA_END=1195 /DNA_ORIENTATION=-